jgi:Fe-S-cluster containining protein
MHPIFVNPHVQVAIVPLNELEYAGKCMRCWFCCITTREDLDWQRFYRDFELPLHWMLLTIEKPTVHICPFLGANSNGEPECLIYTERPEMCVATVCKWMTNTRV